MCPVCGTPLELATEAPQAKRERALIQHLVDDCRSKDQIKDRLVAEYGDEVLATPGDGGFDLAAYLVPALAMRWRAGPRWRIAALQWRRRGMRSGPRAPAPAPAAPPSACSPTSTGTTCDRLADGVDTTVVAAFAVGFISFISPCVLPLVPGYLSTISGVSFAEIQAGKGRSKVLGPALLFCLSFTVMFVALGMTATGFGSALQDNRRLLQQIAGVVLIVARAVVHRHPVREPAQPRVAARDAAVPGLDRRADRGRAGLRGGVAAVHGPHPGRHPDRREHRGQRRQGWRAAGVLRARPGGAVHPERAGVLVGVGLLPLLPRPLHARSPWSPARCWW